MTMKWRPDNWKGIKQDLRNLPPGEIGVDPYGDIFELGADAMLGVLRERGHRDDGELNDNTICERPA